MSICPDCLTAFRVQETHCVYCEAPTQKQDIETILRSTNPMVWKAVIVGVVFVFAISLALIGLDALFPTEQITAHAVFSKNSEVDLIAAAFNP